MSYTTLFFFFFFFLKMWARGRAAPGVLFKFSEEG